jgi:hypothetical protein
MTCINLYKTDQECQDNEVKHIQIWRREKNIDEIQNSKMSDRFCIGRQHQKCHYLSIRTKKLGPSVADPSNFSTDPGASPRLRTSGQSGCGYGRTKNIRIRNTGTFTSFFKDSKS